jgi:hypothetical protein
LKTGFRLAARVFGRLPLQKELAPKAVHLDFMKALARPLGQNLGIGQHAQTCFDFPLLAQCFGQQSEVVGPVSFTPGSRPCGQPLAQLGDAVDPRPLLGQGPPAHDLAASQPEREPVLGRDRRRGLGARLNRRPLAAVLMEHRGEVERQGERAGLAQFSAQGDRLAAALQRLVRIAQQPEGDGPEGQASHSGILPVDEGVAAVPPRVVQGGPLLHMPASGGWLSEAE